MVDQAMVEAFARAQILKALDEVVKTFGLSMDSPLVLRVLRAIPAPEGTTPEGTTEFCAFCGKGFVKTRRWHRFCGLDCRYHYHGQRRVAS